MADGFAITLKVWGDLQATRFRLHSSAWYGTVAHSFATVSIIAFELLGLVPGPGVGSGRHPHIHDSVSVLYLLTHLPWSYMSPFHRFHGGHSKDPMVVSAGRSIMGTRWVHAVCQQVHGFRSTSISSCFVCISPSTSSSFLSLPWAFCLAMVVEAETVW